MIMKQYDFIEIILHCFVKKIFLNQKIYYEQFIVVEFKNIRVNELTGPSSERSMTKYRLAVNLAGAYSNFKQNSRTIAYSSGVKCFDEYSTNCCMGPTCYKKIEIIVVYLKYPK